MCILEDVNSEWTKILIDAGICEKKTDDILKKLADSFQYNFCGESHYIKTYAQENKKIRNQHIISEFSGGNFRELARKYSISVSSVKRILRKGDY